MKAIFFLYAKRAYTILTAVPALVEYPFFTKSSLSLRDRSKGVLHQSRNLCILSLLPVIFAFSPGALATNAGLESPSSQETVVTDKKAKGKTTTSVPIDQDVQASLSPTQALLSVPGLTLSESSGPLGPSSFQFRGLSHSRFLVDLEGLPQNDPATGIVDANALFLFSAYQLEANSHSLSVKLPHFEKPYFKTTLGFGHFETYRFSTQAGGPVHDHGHLFIATLLSSTKGNYEYEVKGSSGNKNPTILERSNNDQQRWQNLLHYQFDTEEKKLNALWTFQTHEGGIAGFALAPTPLARTKSFATGLQASGSLKLGPTEFSLILQNALSQHSSTDQNGIIDAISSSSHEILLGMSPKDLPSHMQFRFGPQFIFSQAYELNQNRLGFGFFLERFVRLPGKWHLTTFGTMDMKAFDQLGFVMRSVAGLGISPRSGLELQAKFVRSQRLPTYMELFANQPFFVGNPNLNKESQWDLELNAIFLLPRETQLQLSPFYGHTHDFIAYVPYLATAQRPENTGKGRRAGIDLSLTSRLAPWLFIEANAGYLYTRLADTQSPLPHAPAFSGLAKARLGKEQGTHLTLQSRFRGPSASNIYGTLYSHAYALVDAIGYVQVSTPLALSVAVNNILNVRDATDLYQQPLPGTSIFIQMELSNL